MWGKSFLCYQIKRAARESGPFALKGISEGCVPSVQVVVQADAHDIVGDMGAQWNRRNVVGERAEVHEEIFELGGPVAAHHALDAAADRVAGLGGVEVGGRRGGADAGEPGRDGEDGGDDLVAVNSAIGKTSGGVEQPRRSRENAGSCPHRAEPYELFLVAQGDVGRQGAGKGAAEAAGGRDVRRRRAALAAALDVGLKTEQPV